VKCRYFKKTNISQRSVAKRLKYSINSVVQCCTKRFTITAAKYGADVKIQTVQMAPRKII